MNTAIKAKNLSKRYFLNRKGRNLFDRRRLGDELWALKDMSFHIEKGESLGIIGANGAGKTTLLKILGNVTKPTTGSLVLQGRIGALIELGAGFHPELSGLENIFLYGSILGMKKKEISEKLDRIVDFAELDAFMDTPVKRYSSGMYVRLAFSIAAHVDPDILIVDEVLAVGDLHFQKKCFDWVQNYVKSQKTFVLVSHQLNQIETVCQRVLYLKRGRLVFDGPPDKAISRFMSDGGIRSRSAGPTQIPANKKKTGELDVVGVNLYSDGVDPTDSVIQDRPLSVEIHVCTEKRIVRPKIEFAFLRGGITLGQANTVSDEAGPEVIEGEGLVSFHWPRCFLSPGHYTIDIYVSDGITAADLCVWRSALEFHVVLPDGNSLGSGNPGIFKIPGKWSFESK